jgi:hypothetical protein
MYVTFKCYGGILLQVLKEYFVDVYECDLQSDLKWNTFHDYEMVFQIAFYDRNYHNYFIQFNYRRGYKESSWKLLL